MECLASFVSLKVISQSGGYFTDPPPLLTPCLPSQIGGNLIYWTGVEGTSLQILGQRVALAFPVDFELLCLPQSSREESYSPTLSLYSAGVSSAFFCKHLLHTTLILADCTVGVGQ